MILVHPRTALGAAIVMLAMTACSVTPQHLTEAELETRVSRDLSVLTRGQEPVTGPVDLYEAMARTLKYNLDARVQLMKTMLAHQNLDVSRYELLPRLVANGAYDGRNNFSGGSSFSLLSGRQSLEPSTSSEKDVFSSNLTLSWDVLDFGLSYIRAKQAADDVLIAEEERRRVAIRLLQNVRAAYWRAVSAERMLARLDFLHEWIDKALDRSETIQERRLESPLVALQYRRELLNSQREIQKLYRELATAKTELAALMNLPPDQYYELDMPDREGPALAVDLTPEQMEQRALLNRPELRVVDYRKRINARETKAALLELLPNMSLEVGGNYNSNKFLFKNNWLAYGAKVSWNLIQLFRQPAKLELIDVQAHVLDAQGLALTMAVMTQVHVRVAQLLHAGKELETAKSYYDTQVKIAEQTRLSWIANRTGVQALIREKVNEVLAELRYDTAKADREAAYANLLAAIGDDPLPDVLTGHSVTRLARALQARWEVRTTERSTP